MTQGPALSPLFCGFDDSADQTRFLAAAWGSSARAAGTLPSVCIAGAHRFPDGEVRVRLDLEGQKNKRAVICRSLDRPDGKLIELLFAASALRDQGVEKIALVAPYLAYMRQDTAFRPGEAVSQKVMAGLLEGAFDGLVTVDPHLHRVARLEEVFQRMETGCLSAAGSLADLLRKENVSPDTLLLGPDAESIHQIGAVAKAAGLGAVTAIKERRGDRQVAISLPDPGQFRDRPVILVDDVISTGQTLIACAEAALKAGAKSVDAYAVHALYPAQVGKAFTKAGIGRVKSCDGVPHPSNAAPLAPLLAEGLTALAEFNRP